MKILIQHNFRTGLGDMYSDMSEYMTIASDLKKIGYEINLIFCLHSNRYVKEPIFYKIFDKSTIDFFDSVEETFSPIKDDLYDGYKHYYSAHDPQSPGWHRWDLFINQEPEKIIPRIRYSASSFDNHGTSQIRPKFSKQILERVNEFENTFGTDYDFLHVRFVDSEYLPEKFKLVAEKVENFIDEEKKLFYLGTNNQFIYDYFKNKKNILTYSFKTMEYLDNDVNRIDIYDGENVLFDRFCDIIAEMILIKNSKNIYHYSDIGWVSNFYFYAFCERNIRINDIDLKKYITI